MISIEKTLRIAVLHYNEKRYPQAEALLAQILEREPKELRAAKYLGCVANAQRRFDDAIEILGKICSIKPDEADVLNQLGRAYIGANRLKDAATCLQRATILEPENPSVLKNLAELRMVEDNPQSAIIYLEAAIRVDPSHSEAYSLLGKAFLQLEEYDHSASCFTRATELQQDNWRAYTDLGRAYYMQDDLEKAQDSLETALLLDPGNQQVSIMLSSVLTERGDYSESDSLLNAVAATMPMSPEIHVKRGINAFRSGRIHDATTRYLRALEQASESPYIYNLLGLAKRQQGEMDKSLELFDKAIKLDRSFENVFLDSAQTLLLTGKVREGITRLAEWASLVPSPFEKPVWNGETLQNQRILLHARGGASEFIALFRFARKVKEIGGFVIVHVPEPMAELVENCRFVDSVWIHGEPKPSFDIHVPLERLPYDFKMSYNDLPSGRILSKTIASDPTVNPIVKTPDQLTVGLLWRNETDRVFNAYRSLPFDAYRPLLEDNRLKCFSLQTGPGLAGLSELETSGLNLPFGNTEGSLTQQLSLAMELDVVLTPDTLFAQIASAEGANVWVILDTAPRWFWMLDADKTPWYPEARLFRQKSQGDWHTVIGEVTTSLHETLRSR